jgi:tetratricopeptide (TPR) repeat protein
MLRRCRYTQCIALSPGGERDTKLLCNRSLALLKAGRHALSAEDADRACKLSPEWNKAWFRRGAAHAALGDHAAALASYSCGLRLDPDNREVRAAVRATVRRLTREQLAAELLQRLAALQASGALLPPEKEDVSDAERSEAMFRHLYMWMRDKPAPGDYYDYVTLWSEAPWTAGAQRGHACALRAHCCALALPATHSLSILLLLVTCTGMAYLHRAAMYVRAKCYAQAGCDAAAAAALFESSSSVAAARLPGQPDPNRLVVTHIHKPGTTEPFLRARLDPLAWAWCATAHALYPRRMHGVRAQLLTRASARDRPAAAPSSGFCAARRTPRRMATPRRTGAQLPAASSAPWTSTRCTQTMHCGWQTPPAS